MKVELNRIGLEALVMGSELNYGQFDHPLVKKAGHEFIDSTQTH